MIELLQRAAIVGVLIGIATALGVHLLARASRPFRGLPPRHRAVALETALALPWLVPLVVLGAALAPSILASFWPALDHCAAHDDHHDHFCLLHPPHGGSVHVWTLLAMVCLVPVGLRLVRTVRRLVEAHAAIREVRRAARPAADGTLRIETDLPMCAAIGLTDTAVLVSDGARSRVSVEHLAIMLAHERAHVARRDVLRHALALLAATAHAPSTGVAFLHELAVAREQACDEAAAHAHGDRLSVAEAILHAARVFGADPALPSAASAPFGPAALASRVASLIEDPLSLPRAAKPSVLGALAITTLALPAVHHVLETLLDAVLH